MAGVLQFASYCSWSDHDIVFLSVEGRTISCWYQDGFALAQDIRLACKQAMQFEQTAARHWRDLAEIAENEREIKPNATYRRSRIQPNLKLWETACEGPVVVITFIDHSGGTFEAKTHFSDALKLHAAVRVSSQSAKAWAGDFSKVRRVIGTLTSAEENDKLRVN